MEIPWEPVRKLRATFCRSHSHRIPPASTTVARHISSVCGQQKHRTSYIYLFIQLCYLLEENLLPLAHISPIERKHQPSTAHSDHPALHGRVWWSSLSSMVHEPTQTGTFQFPHTMSLPESFPNTKFPCSRDLISHDLISCSANINLLHCCLGQAVELCISVVSISSLIA